jgi:4-hydroxy-2-oxoglutarate aldolase
MTKTFAGIFPALLTPFINDEIAVDRFMDNIRKYDAFDLAGYVVLGSTGECVSITDDEAALLVKAAREAARPGKKIIAGTARESTRLTTDFTNRAADLGVNAALVRPPSYYKAKMTRDVLKRHYLDVADRSRVPIILYNIPQNTQITLEAALILELAQHPNIVGLKESGGNIALVGELVPKLPEDFSYVLGAGSAFLPALLMGASGAILSVANAAPGVCARIYRLFQEGKIREAADLQTALIPLNKAVMETYGIAGVKCALDLQGWYGGPVRGPLSQIDEKGKADLAAILRTLGLIS